MTIGSRQVCIVNLGSRMRVKPEGVGGLIEGWRGGSFFSSDYLLLWKWEFKKTRTRYSDFFSKRRWKGRILWKICFVGASNWLIIGHRIHVFGHMGPWALVIRTPSLVYPSTLSSFFPQNKLAHPLSIAANGDCGQLGSLRRPALACGSSWRPLSVPFLLSDSLLSHPPPSPCELYLRLSVPPSSGLSLQSQDFKSFLPQTPSLCYTHAERAPWGQAGQVQLLEFEWLRFEPWSRLDQLYVSGKSLWLLWNVVSSATVLKIMMLTLNRV